MIIYSGKIIAIAGPTASGKSDIAIRLAKDIGGYVINGDSRQIYKHLSIGTAKPKPDEILDDGTWIISGIRHHLYDFIDPKENYTLFDYQNSVQQILDREKGTPILVGGTGLYIDSVIFNYDLKRNDIKSNYSRLSLEELQSKASKYLPNMTESDRGNRHRLIRVLQRNGYGRNKGEELNNIYFVLDIPKDILKERIKERIEYMFSNGLVEENKKLLELGYTYDGKGLNSIGYKEFKDYFDKGITLEEVKEKIYKNTCAYAKRQRTWFKRNKDSIWSNSYDNILDLASNFIRRE